MHFLQAYGKELFALVVPLFTWWLNALLKARASLRWSAAHSFTFLVQEPLLDAQGEVIARVQRVITQSTLLANQGKEKASNIDVTFNWKPRCVNVWPVRVFAETVSADGRYTLTFSSLAPKEQLGIEILQINADMPRVVNVRCDECVGREFAVRWIEQIAAWQARAIVFFVVVGLGSSVYLATVLVQWLVLKT